MLKCGGCGKDIPEREAEYYELTGKEPILKPCKECLEKAKKQMDAYPKASQYRKK
jgi:hypothetical protein